MSFPPLSEHSDEGAPHSGPRGTEPEPLLLPLGGRAGRQAPGCGGQGLFPGTSGESEQPGGVGRERRPVRRTQEGARESVTQGIFCRVSAKLAEQTPEPGVRGQGDVASGPCGPPLPFLEKACFPGQNPTPDPPPRGRMFWKARWSRHPVRALLLPSPHPQGLQSPWSHWSWGPSVPRSGARLCLRGQHGFCSSGAADELRPGGGQLESHVPVLPPWPRDDLVYVRSSKPRPPCLFILGGRGTSLRPPRGDWAGSGKPVKLVQAGRVGRGRWRRRPEPPWAPTSSCWA